MANSAELISGQICWPSPGSFTGHQRAHLLAARGKKELAIDTCFPLAVVEPARHFREGTSVPSY